MAFGGLKVETRDPHHVFEVEVYLSGLDPDAVRVEVFADAPDGGGPTRQLMSRGEPLTGSAGGYLYSAKVPATRPAGNYTARIVPFKAEASVPLEAPQILWQR